MIEFWVNMLVMEGRVFNNLDKIIILENSRIEFHQREKAFILSTI